LPQGHQLLQRVRDGCKLQHFANQRRSHGSHAQREDGNYHHRQHGQQEQQQQQQEQATKKNTAVVTRTPCFCAQRSLDKQQIELPGRASDTVFSDERQTQATTTKKLPFL
jgi:hypothetical protein